ncbi:hypothetical protein BH24ACT25_BH24ACT25_04770 [soil metagenome]
MQAFGKSGLLMLAVLCLVALTAESCSTNVKTGSGSGGTETAKLGDPIELKGQTTELRVTAERLIDPLGVGRFDRPLNKGSRFVGVEVTIENVGDKTYSDAPANGATLLTADDQQADLAFISGGECGDFFSSDVQIAPGSRQVGCLPFEVPQGGKPARFQFGPDSGFGPQTGEWMLR